MATQLALCWHPAATPKRMKRGSGSMAWTNWTQTHSSSTPAPCRDGEHLVTDGGRVMTIVRCEDTLRMARDKVYEQVGRVEFENMYYRRDIARREL